MQAHAWRGRGRWGAGRRNSLRTWEGRPHRRRPALPLGPLRGAVTGCPASPMVQEAPTHCRCVGPALGCHDSHTSVRTCSRCAQTAAPGAGSWRASRFPLNPEILAPCFEMSHPLSPFVIIIIFFYHLLSLETWSGTSQTIAELSNRVAKGSLLPPSRGQALGQGGPLPQSSQLAQCGAV